jgi:hypothetical protein
MPGSLCLYWMEGLGHLVLLIFILTDLMAFEILLYHNPYYKLEIFGSHLMRLDQQACH